MQKTKIEWCDSTWNPVTGCLHGCEYCYARKIANRFGGDYCDDVDGTIHCLDKPLYKAISNKCADEEVYAKEIITPYPYYFEPTFHKYRLGEPTKKIKGQNVFVCSMADLFGDWVPIKWIEEIFEVCEKSPQHNYLFLTKNPKRYFELANKGLLLNKPNLWYGYSMTNNKDRGFVSENHNTFASVEPILERLTYFDDSRGSTAFPIANWIIIGAETGNRKGKIIPKKEWIVSIVEQCKETNIPIFMKDSLVDIMGEENMLREFPKELRR